jgi:hypothetical protein
MADLRILPACVVLMVVVVCTVAVRSSGYRQDCLAAGYTRVTGQLWDPYCVRKGALGQDEIRRLSELKEQ